MNITTTELTNIFASRSGLFVADRQQISDLCFLIENQYLHITKVPFCSKELFLKTIDMISSGEINAFDIQGGKTEHMALKSIAKEKYAQHAPSVEVGFMGRVPDVMYRQDARVCIIECGNTDPAKVIDYFEDGAVASMEVVPFPYAEDELLYSYKFVPGEDFVEFVDFWKKEKIQEIRKIFNR